MKNSNYLAIAICGFAIAFLAVSCQEDELVTPDKYGLESTLSKEEIPVTVLSNSAIVNGKPIREYTKDWWKYVLSFDCAHNPLFDNSGTSLQGGPVHCLVGETDGPSVKYVELGRGKTILVPVVNVIKNYPSPDPAFKPAPGQSVTQFLKREAQQFINQATEKSASLDGRPIPIDESKRITTSLFTLKGNKDLVNCLDCITGKTQSGVSDGYWLVLKDLPVGQHTLDVVSKVPEKGFEVNTTFIITVR